jgi:hypothetical protein
MSEQAIFLAALDKDPVLQVEQQRKPAGKNPRRRYPSGRLPPG